MMAAPIAKRWLRRCGTVELRQAGNVPRKARHLIRSGFQQLDKAFVEFYLFAGLPLFRGEGGTVDR